MYWRSRKAIKEAEKFILYIETIYKIRREGKGGWFLNIRIIQDYKARKL